MSARSSSKGEGVRRKDGAAAMNGDHFRVARDEGAIACRRWRP